MKSYRFRADAPVPVEVRRIASDQVDRALADLDGDDRDEAVHEVRRRCKKVRALVRLLHGSAKDLHRRENQAFGDIARALSGVREVAALVDAFDPLVHRYATALDRQRLAPIRDGLLDHRERVRDEFDAGMTTARDELSAARMRIGTWELGAEGFEAMRGGLARSYRRARDRGTDAYDQPSTSAFHEWRKRVKDHRYQVQLLQGCWTRVLSARRQELHALTDLLGEDHDLAVLRDTLHEAVDQHGGAELVAACTALIDRRRAQLQHDARHLGRRCFADDPGPFVDRFATYWQAWHDEPAGPSELADATVPAGA